MRRCRKGTQPNAPSSAYPIIWPIAAARFAAWPIFYYAGVNVATGAFLYHWLEGWNLLDSFYFVIITLTTIGYGDFSPTMPITKLLTIFYGLNGAAILLMLFDKIRRLRRHKLNEAVDQLRSRAGDNS